MLAPQNKNKKLVGWWSFDDNYAHDSSGNNLDGTPVPEVGPSHCKFYFNFFLITQIFYKKKFPNKKI
jgi:hypothetical protein